VYWGGYKLLVFKRLIGVAADTMGFPLKQASLYANDAVAELEKFCSDAAGVQVDYC
jgi:hypothetical protein